ncbi:hypothetical protein [Xanthobacter aminoxidans]|uniref:Uncharacterized protein n=1 Tax=Xanthobacter aminoxidans TaxID=186280 RepID=A0ABW6Z9Z7_9HYPH
MTTKPKLDARARLASAEAAVARWRKSIAAAEADKLRAADRGDHNRVVSILDKLERLKDRLAAAEVRLVHLREGLPKALKREQAVKRAVRGGVKLAERVAASAPVAAAGWAADREKARVADLRRRRRGVKAEGEDGKVARGRKEVPDPWEPGARISVPCNTRESPIEHMAARKRIDAAQKAAADRYRAVYERAQLGPLRAMDPAKEKLDGGGSGDAFSDGMLDAARELAATNRSVGRVAAALLIDVVGEGVTLDEMAKRYPHLQDKRAQGYVTGRLIEALDQLVDRWGLIAEGQLKPQARGSGPISISGPQVEHDLVRPARAVDKLMHLPSLAKST